MSEPAKCPDCRGFGPKQKGGCPTCGGFNDGAAAKLTQAEPLGVAPNHETSVPPVDPEVLDRALEIQHFCFTPEDEGLVACPRMAASWVTTEDHERSLAAAYRQGKEDGLREALERAEAFLNSHKVYSADDLLRSLLTDKEEA